MPANLQDTGPRESTEETGGDRRLTRYTEGKRVGGLTTRSDSRNRNTQHSSSTRCAGGDIRASGSQKASRPLLQVLYCRHSRRDLRRTRALRPRRPRRPHRPRRARTTLRSRGRGIRGRYGATSASLCRDRSTRLVVSFRLQPGNAWQCGGEAERGGRERGGSDGRAEESRASLRLASLGRHLLTAQHTLPGIVRPGNGLDARVVGGRAPGYDDAVLARDCCQHLKEHLKGRGDVLARQRSCTPTSWRRSPYHVQREARLHAALASSALMLETASQLYFVADVRALGIDAAVLSTEMNTEAAGRTGRLGRHGGCG